MPDPDNTSQKPASLTQWIFRRGVEEVVIDGAYDGAFIECLECGLKQMPRKEGSLTQWILQPLYCRCAIDGMAGSNASLSRGRAIGSESDSRAAPGFELEDIDAIEVTGEAPAEFPDDRFKFVRRIGGGASGTICLAVDRLLLKRVAIKLLHVTNQSAYMDFQNEARAVSILDHPNILKVLDFAVSESGAPYMVMEYLEGVPFHTYISSFAPLEVGEALSFMAPIVEAIASAHSRGVLHRDLKPENILIVGSSGDASIKVVDFGLSRIEREDLYETAGGNRMIAGTPAYMSPDVFRGRAFDPRSDIYSLGVVLFEALTGSQPYEADSAIALLSLKSTQAPPSLGQAIDREFPPEVEALVQKAMALEPEARFQTMTELKEALEQCLEKIAYRGRESDAPAVAASPSRKPLSAGLIASILGLGFLGICLSFFFVYKYFESTLAERGKQEKPVAESPRLHIQQLEAMEGVSGEIRAIYEKAKHGDIPSMIELGDILFKGEGVAKNIPAARKTYEVAASAGDTNAQNRLGWLLEQSGNESEKAKEWYRKAALKGHKEAALNLTRLLRYEEIGFRNSGKPRNFSPEELIKWHKILADKGDPTALQFLSTYYEEGRYLPRDDAKAAELLEKAAKAGSAQAALGLANRYEAGQGVEKDPEKAKQWLAFAARRGDPVTSALAKSGGFKNMHMSPTAKMLESDAKKGDAGSMGRLGAFYLVEKQYDKALPWLEKAAAKGDLSACGNLGYMYDNGAGVKKNYQKAFKYFSKAAEEGTPVSLSNLAEAYELGHGTPVNYGKAMALYRKAAEAKYAAAELAVARMLEKGLGAEPDPKQADHWYRRAAFHGSLEARRKVYGTEAELVRQKKPVTERYIKIDGIWVLQQGHR